MADGIEGPARRRGAHGPGDRLGGLVPVRHALTAVTADVDELIAAADPPPPR